MSPMSGLMFPCQLPHTRRVVGAGTPHVTAPSVASPPAPAHVVLVLALVLAPTLAGLVSVCHRLVGSRGRSVSLPAAAGLGLERCRRLERCRGRLLRAVSRI